MKNKNVITVVNLLRCLDLTSLSNPEVVANLVRTFGLMNWGVNVSGQEVKYITSGCAAIGQTPDQIAKALVYLSKFEINSFCEIGLYYGGNLLFCSEYLRRFNPDIQCTGIDPNDYIDSEVREILPEWIIIKRQTSSDMVGEKFDFVFIDADHTTVEIQKDYNNVGRFAKICGFHDIQDSMWPDAGKFWSGLTDKRMVKVEFLDDLSNCNTHGIGIIHRKEVK